MKNKELKQRLSRLESRAYKLHEMIKDLVGDLNREENESQTGGKNE